MSIAKAMTALRQVASTKVAQPAFSLQSPASFFAQAKTVTGSLNQKQVDTINGIFAACHDWPLPWVAYALATAWHECRLEPIREWGRGKGRKYGVPGKYGQVPYGRGLVQLTWDYNYEWADERLGLGGALLQDFDLALDPVVAAQILRLGMEEGAFNPKGKGIAAYIPRNTYIRADFVRARTLINLTDKADLIADHAVKFAAALRQGGWR